MQDESFALYYASQEGYEEIVELLITAGAAVDLQNKVRITKALNIGPLSLPPPTHVHNEMGGVKMLMCSCDHLVTMHIKINYVQCS